MLNISVLNHKHHFGKKLKKQSCQTVLEKTAYIKVRDLFKISVVQIQDELVAVYKQDALSYRQVISLVKDFK